jgi:hypothetical protein
MNIGTHFGKVVLAAGLLLAVSAAARPPESYILIGVADGKALLLDTDSISPRDDGTQAGYVLWVLPGPQNIAAQGVIDYRVQYLFDCKSGALMRGGGVFYGEKGQVLAVSGDQSDASPVVPGDGTIEKALVKSACGGWKIGDHRMAEDRATAVALGQDALAAVK